jgi:hypothetical protein
MPRSTPYHTCFAIDIQGHKKQNKQLYKSMKLQKLYFFITLLIITSCSSKINIAGSVFIGKSLYTTNKITFLPDSTFQFICHIGYTEGRYSIGDNSIILRPMLYAVDTNICSYLYRHIYSNTVLFIDRTRTKIKWENPPFIDIKTKLYYTKGKPDQYNPCIHKINWNAKQRKVLEK